MGAAPQGRDDGDLLRRDQPALHRADQAAEPGRDLAALGDRPHADDALSGRHPQHRVRGRLGQGAGPRRQAGVGPTAGRPGPTSGSRRATRPARPTRPCTPRRRTCWPRSGPTTTTCPRSPTRCRRSPSSTRSTCRPSWPASGPTSRPAATARPWPSTSPARSRKWFTFTNGTHVDSLDPETFNRWYDFLELYVAKQAPITNSRGDPRRRAGDLPGGDGDPRGDAAARPDPAAADLRGRAGRLRAAAADPRPLRQRRRRLAAGPAAPRLRAVLRPRFPIPGTKARSWYLATGGAPERQPARRARAPNSFTWDAHARPLTDFTRRHRRGRRRPLDRHAAVPLGAEPAGQRRLLPDQAR